MIYPIILEYIKKCVFNFKFLKQYIKNSTIILKQINQMFLYLPFLGIEPHYNPVGTIIGYTIQNFNSNYCYINKVNCKIGTYNLENFSFRCNVEHIIKIWKTRILST